MTIDSTGRATATASPTTASPAPATASASPASDAARPGVALDVRDLCIDVSVGGRRYRAVDHLSLTVRDGEARGLVGESGSGKSLTLRAIIGLLNRGARVASGSIRVAGREVLGPTRPRFDASIRGSGVSMVFQEPAVALNPVMKVGRQIIDAAASREHLSRRQARARAIELMRAVGITQPEERFDSYPFELSGGMRQRVMIAAAIACKPKVLLCDEPTTALDATIQKQIIDIFAKTRDTMGTAILYVTHDLAVVAELCTQLSVIYGGTIVEEGPLQHVFDHPAHPYTRALLRSTPYLHASRRPEAIRGAAPAVTDIPSGCPFAPRCAYVQDVCTRERPRLRGHGAGTRVACHVVDSLNEPLAATAAAGSGAPRTPAREALR